MKSFRIIFGLSLLSLSLLLAGCGAGTGDKAGDSSGGAVVLSTPADRGEQVARSVCTKCHKVNGIGVGTAPELSKAALKYKQTADLAKFLHEPLGQGKEMPKQRLSTGEILDVATYLVIMSQGEEAGKQAKAASAGEVIYTTVCGDCHKFGAEGGKAGPDLTNIGQKLSEEDIKKYILNPQGKDQAIIMPKLGITPEIAGEIARYLSGKPQPSTQPVQVGSSFAIPEVLVGNEPPVVARVLEKYKCRLCHVIKGKGGNIGPDLSAVKGEKAASWLARYLQDPQNAKPGSKMPNLGLSSQEIKEVVKYLTN